MNSLSTGFFTVKRALLVLGCAALAISTPADAKVQRKKPSAPARQLVRDGEAEARLLEVYRLIGQAAGRQALAKAESLVSDHPNFQLAQLVLGDLLAG